MNYVISTTLQRSYDNTVSDVRDALAEQGFGVLTEIDLKAALKEKLDVDIAPRSSSAPAVHSWPMKLSRPNRPSRRSCPATSW